MVSSYVSNALLNWLKGSAMPAPPASLLLALCTGSPGTGGGDGGYAIANECSGHSYARQAIAFGTVANGAMADSGLIGFPAATGAYAAPVTHFAVMGVDGKYLGGAALTAPKTIGDGVTPTVPIAAITAALT